MTEERNGVRSLVSSRPRFLLSADAVKRRCRVINPNPAPHITPLSIPVPRDRGRFGFEAERQIEPQLVGAQSPRMAVTFGPEGVVFGPIDGVVLNRVLRPVIRGVSQAMIAGIPAYRSQFLPLRRVTGADPHRSRNT